MRRPVPFLFIGAPTTGKSTLLAHIEAQSFEERYIPTEKSHFVIHMMNSTTSLQIWEVTGRVGVSRSILCKARCVVLFVDLSNPATLDDLNTVYERFKLGAGLDHDSWPCVVCGTKLDLCFGGGSAVLSESDLHRWSARRRPMAEVDSFSPSSDSRIKVYVVSSRTGAGISAMISYLASLVESDTSLTSRTPMKNDESTGGSVYGGSQLSYSSYEGDASPLSSSSLPAAVWPFSDLTTRTPQTQQQRAQHAQQVNSPSTATSDPLDSMSEVSEATSSQVSGMSSSLYSSQTSPESDVSGSVSGMRNMNKVVVIGGAGAGKTGLLQKYSSPQMKSIQVPYEPTVGADCREMVVNGVVMQVWDTSGNPNMLPLGRSLYKHARGAVLVFDVNSRKSFEEIQVYFDNFRKHARNHYAPIILVGNKTDLRRKGLDYVRADESYSWLSKHSLPASCYLETSLLEPASISAVFDLLSRSFEDDRAGSHSHSPVKTVNHHRMSPAQGYNAVRASPLPRIDSASRIESEGGGASHLKKARETHRQRQQQQHSLLPEISRHQDAGVSPSLRSPSQPNEEKACDVFAVFSFW